MNNKLIYGVGICNKGKYNASINRKHTKCYTVWFAMLQRCYSDKYHEKHPTYIDCQVYKDWLYFQSFAKWYHENYYEIIGQKMALDKDILCKGNKIYSPETCIFVPQSINLLFTKTDAKRGELPIGVSYHKQNKKYQANCNIGNKNRVYLGLFNTPEEAFSKYKEFKEQYIKEIAEQYKSQIPVKLYETMINYTVEFND